MHKLIPVSFKQNKMSVYLSINQMRNISLILQRLLFLDTKIRDDFDSTVNIYFLIRRFNIIIHGKLNYCYPF